MGSKLVHEKRRGGEGGMNSKDMYRSESKIRVLEGSLRLATAQQSVSRGKRGASISTLQTS